MVCTFTSLIAFAVFGVLAVGFANLPRLGARIRQSRPRKSGQDDRWSFCLTAGTLCPSNQEIR